MKISTNERSSWYRWFSTQLPIRILITLGWMRVGGVRVKCKNCLTMAGTGKRSPAARCSRVKNTSLCSLPNVESSALSINRRSMLSGTSQYTFNSSIVWDAMTLFAEGVARKVSLGGALRDDHLWKFLPNPSPFYKQIKRRGETRKRTLDPRHISNWYKSIPLARGISCPGGISIKTCPFSSRLLTAGNPSPIKDQHY